MHYLRSGLLCLTLALLGGCQSQYRKTLRNELNAAGFSVSLGWKWNYDELPPEVTESEGQVGRWASQQKRGSGQQVNGFNPPEASGFSLGAITATTILVNRAATFPTGTGAWTTIAVNTVTGVVFGPGPGIGATSTITALTSGQTYRVYIAWCTQAGARVSDYQYLATQTTP